MEGITVIQWVFERINQYFSALNSVYTPFGFTWLYYIFGFAMFSALIYFLGRLFGAFQKDRSGWDKRAKGLRRKHGID